MAGSCVLISDCIVLVAAILMTNHIYGNEASNPLDSEQYQLRVESISYPTSVLAKVQVSINSQDSSDESNESDASSFEISAQWDSNGVSYKYMTDESSLNDGIYTLYVSVLTQLTTYQVNLYVNGIFDQTISVTTLALPSGLTAKMESIDMDTVNQAYDAGLYVVLAYTSTENYLCAIHSLTGNIVAYVSINDGRDYGSKQSSIDINNFEFTMPCTVGLNKLNVENELIGSVFEFEAIYNTDSYPSEDYPDGCPLLHHWTTCLESDPNICYTLGFDWWFDDDTNECYYDDIIYKSNFEDGSVEEFLFFDKNTLPISENNAGVRLPGFFYQYCTERYVNVKSKLDAIGKSTTDCKTRTYFNAITLTNIFGYENTLLINARTRFDGSQILVSRETGNIIWYISPNAGSESMFSFAESDAIYNRPHSSFIYENLENEYGFYDLVMFDNQYNDDATGVSRALGLSLNINTFEITKKFELAQESPDGYGIFNDYCFSPIRSSMRLTKRNTYLALYNCYNYVLATLGGGQRVAILVEFSANDGNVNIINRIYFRYSTDDAVAAGPFSVDYLESWAGEMLA